MTARAGRTGRNAVHEEIRRRILSLELAPGAPLSENELAADLGVSRTPVRESLILLAQEDLVQVFAKVGSFVSRVDPAHVRDAQFLREAVETASLADVPATADPSIVDELRANLLEQERAATDVNRFFQLDEAFHRGLMRLGGHERAWRTVLAAKAHLDRARRLGIQEQRTAEVFYHQHDAILTALLTGPRARAVELLRAHLRVVFTDIETVRHEHPELFASNTTGQPSRRNVAVWE